MVLLRTGRYQAAVPALREARRIMRTLSMAEEAGLAGVDLVQAWLALDRRNAARRLLLVVVEEFRRAQLDERALVALEYLENVG